MVRLKRDKNLIEPSPGLFTELLRSLDVMDPLPRHPKERTIGICAVVTVLSIVSGLFLTRAFSIDDPLFIWAARYIQGHPANPYAFSVNWYGFSMPMFDVTKNPPSASYYIALAASLFGWTEPVLHIAFLLPTLAVGIGAYLIAEKLCKHPLLATFTGILTPVFFLSSVTVMSDMLMLAFWVFAVYFWMRGIDENISLFLGLGALSVGVSAISKYFGMTLIPLLFVYTIFKKRRLDWILLYFLIPVAILGWYQIETRHLYGRGLLLDAAAYATERDSAFGKFSLTNAYVDFAFTGGCVATLACFAWQVWSRRAIALALLVAACLGAVFFSLQALGSFALPSDKTTHLLLAMQLAVWGVAGSSIMALCILDFSRERDAESLLLFLWTLGTWIFAGFINWTINGRSLLPLAIPAGILITRRLERLPRLRVKRRALALLPLPAAMILSCVVVWADSRLAETGRTAAKMVSESYGGRERTIWFQGHWGFQYYMERIGAKPMNMKDLHFSRGDIVVVPRTNTNLFKMPSEWSSLRQTFEIPMAKWVSTMNGAAGAGFYADVYGPLPFVFAPIPPERITVFDIK